mgnify:CR=1 FL=1
MSQVSDTIAGASRKTETVLLQALAERSQVRVAELLGVSESTVSRTDKAAMAAFIVACGLKVVKQQFQCFDPEYVRALKTLAGVGLDAPEPKHLEWDQ